MDSYWNRKEIQPLSRGFLLSRGKCCESGCKNCPYFDGVVKKDDES